MEILSTHWYVLVFIGIEVLLISIMNIVGRILIPMIKRNHETDTDECYDEYNYRNIWWVKAIEMTYILYHLPMLIPVAFLKNWKYNGILLCVGTFLFYSILYGILFF